jgi:hypothetical protein
MKETKTKKAITIKDLSKDNIIEEEENISPKNETQDTKPSSPVENEEI